MRIQELERITGSDRATIRFYEKEGLLIPNRSENGYRDYTQENAEELKRILLLRQLGVSIYTISRLQQGSIDFRQVLEEQIQSLTQQISAGKRARAVCQRMCEDRVAYAGMDASTYLDLMKRIPIDDHDGPNPQFRESLPKEIHPWRRYIARWLDNNLLGAAVYFLIIVVLRVRPVPNNFTSIVLAVLLGFLSVPLEAFMLSKWGTTPGKHALGIRVESANGGHLSFQEALERSWAVLRDGVCFYIPLLSQWQMVRRWLQLTGRSWRRFAKREDIPDPEDMPWDETVELVYEPQTRKRGVVLAGIILFIVTLNVCGSLDSIKPKYRGTELTIEQFAENYNDLADMLHPDGNFLGKLQKDGSPVPIPENVIDLGMSGKLSPETPEVYIYETSDGIIQSISVVREWTDVKYNAPMSHSDTVYLTFAILLGQKGFRTSEMYAFTDYLTQNATNPDGTFVYGDVEIRWHIEYENLIWSTDGTFYRNQDNREPSRLRYEYTILLN